MQSPSSLRQASAPRLDLIGCIHHRPNHQPLLLLPRPGPVPHRRHRSSALQLCGERNCLSLHSRCRPARAHAFACAAATSHPAPHFFRPRVTVGAPSFARERLGTAGWKTFCCRTTRRGVSSLAGWQRECKEKAVSSPSAAPQAKAPVFGRMAAGVQGKGGVFSSSPASGRRPEFPGRD